MIYPGDPVYYDKEGRIFKKAGKERLCLGQLSLLNKKPIKEGKKVNFHYAGGEPKMEVCDLKEI